MNDYLKHISSFLTITIFIIIAFFNYRFLTGIMDNGLLNQSEESFKKLGLLFAVGQILYIVVHVAGLVRCIVLFVRRFREVNRYLFYLVLSGLLYSVVSYFWVLHATSLNEIWAEDVLDDYATLPINPDTFSSLISLGIQSTSLSLVRTYYYDNTINAIMMAVPCSVILVIKLMIDKKTTSIQSGEIV